MIVDTINTDYWVKGAWDGSYMELLYSTDGKNFYDVLTTEGKKKYGLDIHSGKNYRLVNGKPV